MLAAVTAAEGVHRRRPRRICYRVILRDSSNWACFNQHIAATAMKNNS